MGGTSRRAPFAPASRRGGPYQGGPDRKILGTRQFARWVAVGLERAHLPGVRVEGAFNGGYFRPCPLRTAIEEGEPGHMGAGCGDFNRGGGGLGAFITAPGGSRGAHPRRHARRTYHVALRFFKRLSPTKIGNVTQLFEKVAHFVWCFCRARTTLIQKLSPAAISSHFNCILNFYTPNGVGESV